MTSSNSYNFISNEQELIADAFTTIGIHFAGETIPVENYEFARRQLNRMIKYWGRKGHLWTIGVGNLILTPGVNTYTLNDTTAHWSDALVNTTVSADEAIGQTAISVTSSTGMTAGDYVGVIQDDDTILWSTISVVNSSVLITLNDALTVAATAGNRVYTYTTIAQPPVRIEWIVRRTTDDIDIELNQLSRKDYDTLSNKELAGMPVSYYYDPKVNNGRLFIYQTPDDPTTTLRITYRRELQDIDLVTQTMDFPIEWEECIVLHLALRISSLGGIGMDDPVYMKTQMMATDILAGLTQHDQDDLPLQIDIDDWSY